MAWVFFIHRIYLPPTVLELARSIIEAAGASDKAVTQVLPALDAHAIEGD